MKKTLQVLIVVILCCLLTACNFTTNFSDATGNAKMDSLPQVEKMLDALIAEDMDTAMQLVHSDRKADAEVMLTQAADYLDGRRVEKLEQTSLSVKNTASTSGNTRQENGILYVTMEDGETFHLSVCYVAQDNAEGFYTFQLILGLV